MPTVSVIVPLYNTEAYIERCLRSLMGQTFPDFEVICVDDASPDGSSNIVRRLMREDPRIKLIRHETNKGAGEARNTGIRASTGVYIASVDSDDTVEPDFLARPVAETMRHPFSVVCFGYRGIDDKGKMIANHSPTEITHYGPPSDPFSFVVPSLCTKLIDRTLFTENGIWVATQTPIDLATTPRLLAAASSVRVIGDMLYNYRVGRPGSIVTTRNSDDTFADHTIAAFAFLRSHFQRAGSFSRLRDAWQARAWQSAAGYERVIFAKPISLLEKARASRLAHEKIRSGLELAAEPWTLERVKRYLGHVKRHLDTVVARLR